MKIQEKIREDLTNALKAKDGSRVSVLRLLLAAIKNQEIKLGSSLEDDQVLEVAMSCAKRHRESIEAFRGGGREDLAGKEESELAVITEYLPKQLTHGELHSVVTQVIELMGASSLKDLGKVMREAMSKIHGKADGKLVNKIARELLGG